MIRLASASHSPTTGRVSVTLEETVSRHTLHLTAPEPVAAVFAALRLEREAQQAALGEVWGGQRGEAGEW